MSTMKCCVVNNNSKRVVIARKIRRQTKCEECFLICFTLCFVVVHLLMFVEARGIARVERSAQNTPYIIDSRVDIRSFNVYWNAPTVQCQQYGINFDELSDTYGLKQNRGDTFRGNSISILYDPGKFPALLENGTQKELFRRNGGVPQEGNLKEHLDAFSKHIEELIPDGAFNGLGVIDFESWRPVFRQNFGKLTPYKETSYQIEKERHFLWPKKWIEKEAARRFEESGRPYMEQTLAMAKEARPLARWGYYAFPYCFNMGGGKNQPNCPDEVVRENNNIQWLWDGSDILLPSVYMSRKSMDAQGRLKMVKGRVAEAIRLSKKSKLSPTIYPYVWYKYQDDTNVFLTKDDLYNSLYYMNKSGLAGAIIWGSSNDVNSKAHCLLLKDYVNNVLGPVVKQFIPLGSHKSDSDLMYDDLKEKVISGEDKINDSMYLETMSDEEVTVLSTTASYTSHTSQKRSTQLELMVKGNDTTFSMTTPPVIAFEEINTKSTAVDEKIKDITPVTSAPGNMSKTTAVFELSSSKTNQIKPTKSPVSNSVAHSKEQYNLDLTTLKSSYVSTGIPLVSDSQIIENPAIQNDGFKTTKFSIEPSPISSSTSNPFDISVNIDAKTDTSNQKSGTSFVSTEITTEDVFILNDDGYIYSELEFKDPKTEDNVYLSILRETHHPHLSKTKPFKSDIGDIKTFTSEQLAFKNHEITEYIPLETTTLDCEVYTKTTEADSTTQNTPSFIPIEPVSENSFQGSGEVLVNGDLTNSVAKDVDDNLKDRSVTYLHKDESSIEDSLSVWEKIKKFFKNAFE